MRALALPGPGQKLVDALGGMILQAGEDVGEPCVRIDIVDPGGVDQRIDRSSAAATLIRASEGPVMATDRNGSDLPLGDVVGHAQPPVVEEARQCDPSGQAISDGFTDVALSGELCELPRQPTAATSRPSSGEFLSITLPSGDEVRFYRVRESGGRTHVNRTVADA